MRPLFETILAYVPAPAGDADAPLQFQVSALDYSSYVGRLGIGRIRRGSIVAGPGSRGPRTARSPKARCRRAAGSARSSCSRGLNRVPVERAAAGDIVLVTGIDDLTIGTTLAAVETARGAAADLGRRADAVDVLPGQHVAARGPRRQVRDVAQPARSPDARAADQHGAARRGDRRHRRVPRVRPRRAASDDPDREHAPRRLRARGVAAARRAEGNRRA